MGVEPGDSGGERGDGVVGVEHRAVPGGPVRLEPQPHDALLAGLDQIGAGLVAQGDGEPAHLADRLRDALEEVGPVVDQPAGTAEAAGLLVGEEGEDQVSPRHDAVALEGPGDGQGHRHHALHVDRAAAPHVAVAHLAGERMDGPLRRVGGHDIEMAVHQQGAPTGWEPGSRAITLPWPRAPDSTYVTS